MQLLTEKRAFDVGKEMRERQLRMTLLVCSTLVTMPLLFGFFAVLEWAGVSEAWQQHVPVLLMPLFVLLVFTVAWAWIVRPIASWFLFRRFRAANRLLKH